MKLRIVADKPVFNCRSVEDIELSGKHRPINYSKGVWWIEDRFEAGFWSLFRKCHFGKTIELRFRADGRFRSIEELRGYVYKEDCLYEDFLYSVFEIGI